MKNKVGADHSEHQKRIKRIEGQMRGIGKMIDEKRYCIDILIQLKAISAAIKSLELNILEGHLNCCVKEAIESKRPSKQKEVIQEIMNLLKKTSR